MKLNQETLQILIKQNEEFIRGEEQKYVDLLCKNI